jgi:hypothetical protein
MNQDKCSKEGLPTLGDKCLEEIYGNYKWRCSDKNCATPCTFDVHCKGFERPSACPFTHEPVEWEKIPDKGFGNLTVTVSIIAPEKEINEAGKAIAELNNLSIQIPGIVDRVQYRDNIQKILNLFEKIESKEALQS